MSLIFVRLWPVAILCVAIALSLPLLVISGSLLFPSLEVWAHLASTVLSDYIINSLIVMVGVGIGTFILGVGPAWLTAMCCFPLHRIFEWALLQRLADYGTVQYFGVSTFTTGIFRTWFGLGEPTAAAQLSALLLLFVLTLIGLEQASRKRARYHHTSHRYRPLPGYRLRGWPAIGAFSA